MCMNSQIEWSNSWDRLPLLSFSDIFSHLVGGMSVQSVYLEHLRTLMCSLKINQCIQDLHACKKPKCDESVVFSKQCSHWSP